MEHETGGGFGPEGTASEEQESKNKCFCQSRKRMSREKTRPTTRANRNQTKVVRAASIRRYRSPFENCTTRLPALLNPSRRVVREADATLPRSRLQCARWTSIIYRWSRPRSVKHRRPRNDPTGSARAKAKWTGNTRARCGR